MNQTMNQTINKTSNQTFRATVAIFCLGLCLLTANRLSAQILIKDDFSLRGDGSLTGAAPSNVHPVGSVWSAGNNTGGLYTTTSFGDGAPSAWGQSQNSGSVSLGDLNSLPTNLLTISASIGMEQLGGGPVGSADGGRGLGLGFFKNATGGQFSQAFFTGLVLDTAGRLNFVHDPNASGFFDSGSLLKTAVAYGGTFNSTAWYDLSYKINTITGAISDITLEGSSADYSSLASGVNLFTAASGNIQHAGVYTSSAGGMSGYAGFDNFTVTAVPEPSAFACLAAGLVGMLALRSRRA
ncbi:MAG: PEP-CTERM sorting domain-containing protein [Verrucomicrobia bacterium]|nr:PEP-CTERM sorting domain-containing protein [Verrucomicrobiota bacterium]NBS78488.1 PEP-CTERM sorting domain-containing protein [bacterium]NBS50425.1 PEP-CTERM sorting domain-containing protein [Verrucomicrobiota bacterium]NBT23679.1 PEP-CTERM sorting domain-containing protein [bacterium]NBV96065.1 PEP-CTERM sorting domain-containing protein [Verrucomicrobiota bacterium]